MSRSLTAHPLPHARISGNRESILPYFSPLKPLHLLSRHRVILWQLSKKSLEAGHRGSMLGRLWLIADPLLLLAIYGFVFGVLFHSKGWDSAVPNDSFILNLYAGILTYGIFSQAANLSTNLIRSSTAYVKQMVFPLEVIPVSAVGAMLIPTAIGSALLILANAIWGTGLSWTVLLLPLALLPIFLLATGTAYAFSALGVFIPDLAKLTQVLTQILFFLTPIVWPVSRLTDRLPRHWHWLPYASPLTVAVESVRAVVLRHELPPLTPWLIATLLGAILCQLGFALFMRCRRAFADVL